MTPGLTRDDVGSGLESSSSSLKSCQMPEPCNGGDKTGNAMPLAIIGFSLKFPGDATSTESFWSMLVEGRCAMTEFPKSRISIDAFHHPDANRTDTLPFRGGHFIEEDIGAFDAPFFSIKPAEAAGMDPQQRGLLETTYRALENAGIPLKKIIGSKTSVHSGCFAVDYLALQVKDPQLASKYAASGLAQSLLANRISWFFDLTGPSVNLDSACSSSMMALDVACQGLRNGDANMALVAGCNLIYDLQTLLSMTNMSFLSRDSRCFSFDHRGNGYARGEGFGVLVVKPLSDAIRDGDTVRAVIRSTGSNQDGRTPGITQPSKVAQENLIKETYNKARLSMKVTRYIEAHGTGTPIGDPIEASAIGAAFREHRSDMEPLYTGSVKANIGHLEGASGVAGIIKTVLMLEKGIIPPIADFERPNPNINSEFLRIKFPRECTPWPSDGLRRASVNSFGFGGTNSHAVLDDAYHFLRHQNLNGNHCTVKRPPSLEEMSQNGRASWRQVSDSFQRLASDPSRAPKPRLLIWSAADEEGLARLCKAYSEYFAGVSLEHDEVDIYLETLAYTLAMRRSSLSWKSFVVVDSVAALQELGASVSKATRSTLEPKLGFIFTGQGAQWQGMGRELLSFPVFRNSLQNADEYLQKLGCPWSLLNEFLKDASTSRINEPTYSQPLCTALQIALVDLLRSFAIYADAVVGHSSGEIAAAYSTGAISDRSAWKIAYHRGALASALAQSSRFKGAMVSVGLSESEIQPYLDDLAGQFGEKDLIVGCINSPENVTVTGSEVQIDLLISLLSKRPTFIRKLQVNVAYHSEQMNEIAFQYLALIEDVTAGEPLLRTPAMISSLTGNRVPVDELRRPEYWVRNMISPVRFSEALTKICSKPDLDGKDVILVNNLLEVGPHSALRGPVRDILRAQASDKLISYDSILVRMTSALDTTFKAIGRLFCAGTPVNLTRVNRFGIKPASHPLVLTDLPEYPFNHSQSYWHESRLSKNYRLRDKPRLDLLGTPVPDWNPFEARWRNIIRVSELTWIEDHKINGIVLYPAGGMLVMAVEAAKQLADPKRMITGFNIRDVVFRTSLSIPLDDEGLETQFLLRHPQQAFNKEQSWSEFRLYSLQRGEWIDNCHGSIQVQYEESETEVDGGKEAKETRRLYSQVYETRSLACTNSLDTRQMYQHMQGCGLDYGPTFQCLKMIACNDNGEATAELKPFEWLPNRDANHPQPHVIHPTTLDGVFQLTFMALSKGGREVIPTAVPTQIRKLWISTLGLNQTSADMVNVYAKSKPRGHRTENSIVGLDKAGDDLRILVEDLEMTVVAGRDVTSQSQTEERRLCYSIDWKPDIDLLSHEQAQRYCQSACPATEEPVQFFRDLRFVMFSYISTSLDAIQGKDLKELKPHLKRYVAWMKLQIERCDSGHLPCTHPQWSALSQDMEYRDALRHQVEYHCKQGKFYVEVGRNLLDILYGEVDPLDLMFKGDLAKDYYQEILNSVTYVEPLKRYLDILAHKNPGMKILEVGAGTGGMTAPILQTMLLHGENEPGTPRYARYDYTDISPSFFEAAQDRFKEHARSMKFTVLNIEDDPSVQGFDEGTYDLVIAASVLHATKVLDVTIQNVRKLLKPGGKLLLLEVTQPDKLGAGFAFGLLPGWWLGTGDDRDWSPCVSQRKWDKILSRNGFTEAELVLHDYQDEWCQETSVMIFTLVDDPKCPMIRPNMTILAEESSLNQQHVARQLQARLQSLGPQSCNILSLKDAAAADDQSQSLCISLLELQNPLLCHLDAQNYAALQSVLRSVSKWLWVTQPNRDQERSSFGIVDGLARVLRSENLRLAFVTLALQSQGRVVEEYAENIVRVVADTITKLADDTYEREYVERDGFLHISRAVEARYLDRYLSCQTSPRQSRQHSFGEGPPLTLTVRSPGLLDTLQFLEDPRVTEPLAPDEVEIEVKAVGLNFKDLLVALGRLDEDHMGTDCAGVITRAGNKANLQVGDRVTMGYGDTFKTYARGPYQCAVKIPDTLPFAEAAALPTILTTAYYALCEVARMRKGESVLIHSAAGGTGQAAIQVSKYLGAEVYVTVGSTDKKHLVKTLYNIPEDHIFYSRNTSFAQGIKRMTNGRGVDVILNSIAYEGLIASWECIAPFGRFIEIGKRDILSNGELPMLPFAQNVTFSAVDIALLRQKRPSEIEMMLGKIMPLVADNKLHAAQPLQVYGVADTEKAFRHMQSGKNMGKLVVEMRKDDQVWAELESRPGYSFDEHATYLISGGLGGLGRSISRWLASRGARNLILLSRSGPRSKEAVALKEELERKAVRVETPACDVADATLLGSVLKQCMQTMPPIKGCIQAAVVFKDSIFEIMSFSDWKASLEPKVQGSWNLHKLLPKGMDFFVLLSSLCGIVGKEGQANYAAGNTYMDALAHHRTDTGEKAASIALGMMEDAGMLAENTDLMAKMRAAGTWMPILPKELHALLDHFCDPALPILSPLKCHAVIGIETPANLRAKSLEPSSWMRQPIGRHFFQLAGTIDSSPSTDASAAKTVVDFSTLFASAGTLAEAGCMVTQALTEKLAKSVSIAKEDVDINQPMHLYGVDSLMAVELRNWFAKKLNADVAVFEILGDSTFAAVGLLVAGRSSYRRVEWGL